MATRQYPSEGPVGSSVIAIEAGRTEQYEPGSAASLMHTELVSVGQDATVEQAIEAIRVNADLVGDLWFVYVLDSQGRLSGAVDLEALLISKPDLLIRALMQENVGVVTGDTDREVVAEMFKRYDLVALPVVDEIGALLGRILVDDVVDVLEREADEDILQMAGVGPAEPELVYTNRIFKIAAVRLPWLLATMCGLSVSALLYWVFQTTFPHAPALIPFIPMISAMGGNVGTQSATIVVRGFANGRVGTHNVGRVVSKELVLGLMMGIVCGAVGGVVAMVWRGNPMLAATVAIAMATAVVVAATIGSVIPYLFRQVGIDPAVASGPLVTTLEDVLATTIYYLLALLIQP